MFRVSNHEENPIKVTMSYLLTTVKMTVSKETKERKQW